MPLQSVINGALQCQVMTKRTKLRCKNPAAYGCKACRMHGAHKSKNVLRGIKHPLYKTGEYSLKVKSERSEKNLTLKYLIDLGNHCDLFYKKLKSRGRPPNGYVRLDLDDLGQLIIAILQTR